MTLNKVGIITAQQSDFISGSVRRAESTIVMPGGVVVTVVSRALPGEQLVPLDHRKKYRVIIIEESE